MSGARRQHMIGGPRYMRSNHRAGAALVELAICLPVFVLITFATIESCRMIYVRQSAKIAAYECARVGILPGVTADAMRDQCDLILDGRNIRSYVFSCDPADPSLLKYGDILTTRVQVSCKDNALIGSWFYRNKQLNETVSIMAEW